MDKYDILSVLGEGAYGIVMKCRNKATGEVVAVKKFKDAEEDESVRKTILREVKLLKALTHENIVGIRETFKRKGKLFIVFEYMEKNILELLELFPGGLSTEVVRRTIYQLLKSLRHCHINGILHRDIKPENLLVRFPNNEGALAKGTMHASQLESLKMDVKLCDFGFARMIPGPQYDAQGNRKKPEEMTVYVSTRWYRAPELLVGLTRYGPEVDIWATGCIMAELLEGRPLFPGESDIDQLFLIQCCLGPMCDAHKEFFDKNPKFAGMRFPATGGEKSLKDRVGAKLPAPGVELLTRLLMQEPGRRPTATDALRHPYFADLMANDAHLRAELAAPAPAPHSAEKPAHHSADKHSRNRLKPQADYGDEADDLAALSMQDRDRRAGPAAGAGAAGAAPAAAARQPPTQRARMPSPPALEASYEDDFESEPSAHTPAVHSSFGRGSAPSGPSPGSADLKTPSGGARTFVIDFLPEGEEESPGTVTRMGFTPATAVPAGNSSRGASSRSGGHGSHDDVGGGATAWESLPAPANIHRPGLGSGSGGPRAFSLNIDELDDQDWEEIDEEDGEFDKLEAELERSHNLDSSPAKPARNSGPGGPARPAHTTGLGLSVSHRTWNARLTIDSDEDDVEEEEVYEDDYEEVEGPRGQRGALPLPSGPLHRAATLPAAPAPAPARSSGSGATTAAQQLARGKSGAAVLLPSARR